MELEMMHYDCGLGHKNYMEFQNPNSSLKEKGQALCQHVNN